MIRRKISLAAECELASQLGTTVIEEDVVDFMKQKLEGSDYTIRWLVNILNEKHSYFRSIMVTDSIEHVDINDIGDGKGHLSKVYRVIFEFQTNKRPFEIIVKFPVISILNKVRKDAGLDEMTDDHEDAQFVFDAHNHECDFYEMVSNQEPPAPFVPRVYYTAKTYPKQKIQGALVMESFFGRTAGLHYFDYVNKNQTINITIALATIHAFVYRLEGQPWRKFEGDAFYSDRMVVVGDRIEEAANEYAITEFPKIETIRTAEFFRHSAFERAKELKAEGIVHGDCWGQNVLFKLNENGTVGDDLECFIDFQMCNVGNPLCDIARWMSACVDADIRREITTGVLDTYYKTLKSELARYNVKCPLTRENVQELYELALVTQVFVCILLTPIFLKKSHSNVEGVDMAREEKWLLRVRLLVEDCIKLIHKNGWIHRFNLENSL
ncbi:unnamed protein product [Bursaphelenchus okinawaensis]|uniref:CHK kinase-like domain-containing protein n=1 Tax=Bursaphelenchus okinawaensis TaxID=465554 RepID=A0A811JUU8_9BILA|nr:unnamed protein product [Bursaphelenchus okinawaensis]CAG9084019.1 unnamed protein product [Bursaphelenchus okinawaensis]